MLRPHIREWLLKLLDVYDNTRTDVFGYGKQALADLYTEILWLLEEAEHPAIHKVLDGDPEMPAEDAPRVTPVSLKAFQAAKEWNEDGRSLNHESIKRNDDALIQWFAEWAMVHFEPSQ